MSKRLAAVVPLVAVLAACGASPATSAKPDPNPQQACREAARYAFEQVMAEPPAMTDDEAQAMLDDKCADVTPADRNAIVDSERSAAIARYLGQ